MLDVFEFRHGSILAKSLMGRGDGTIARRTRRARPRAHPQPITTTQEKSPSRTRVDVPMLVLRGEWLKAIGFPIGATAFLSTDKHGDITLTRMGLKQPRRLRVVKAKS